MMNISTMSDSASSDKNDPKASNDDDTYQEESKMEEIFPWQVKFNELCRSAVGSKSMKMLENLLTVYLQKGSKTVHDCYMKPNRAGKLKKCMSDALVFFHLFYQDIKESFENSTYLEKMTELMAMYLDIEIKASRRRKEHVKKVVCRLTSALNIFLDHSENHILDVIIRAKFINKNYREICSPVLGKLLTSLRVYPMNDTLYVRYLLVFKLWKKVVADADERKNINKIAIQNLPAPSNFMERYKRFNNVLPRVPNSMNVTTFYMQAKFNLKTACQAFMKISKDPQQPIISDKPLFFEGRLASSQSTFSGKANAFECGVSRNLMNDIWSIAEPATSQKKPANGEDGKGDDTSKKKAKDKPNKNGGKKKTKDWFDKEKKKNGKNKTILFGNFRGNNSPSNVPQGDNAEISVSAKEPMAVAVAIALAAKPAAAETLPALAAVRLPEAGEESAGPPPRAVPAIPEALTTERKPLLNMLTPPIQPEVPRVGEDTKPLALRTKEVDSNRADVPRIRLTPPAEEVTKKEAPAAQYAISCRKFDDSRGLGGNLFSGQESITSGEVEECPEKRFVEVTETMEVVKARDLNELMEVRSPAKQVAPVPSVVDPDYLDHDEQDVVNEVTIATSELDISARENDVELPVYLQCHKEVVVETLDEPSSVVGEEESEARSVIVPPRFRPCFSPVPPSHGPEAGRLSVPDDFKFAIPGSPPRPAPDQPVPPYGEVKPELGPPPDDLAFREGPPPVDEELVPDWNQLPFGFFQTSNNSDLFLECMDMRGFELDPVIDPVLDPRAIDPRMLERPVVKRRASEEFQHYPRMYADPNPNPLRPCPPQDFLAADDYSTFAATSDHFPYYSARDLYGNYNPNTFFEEPVSQAPSRGASNRKHVTTNIETEPPPCNTVDYSSNSSNSSNNSILSACDKDNVTRYSRGVRIPSNSDNNYYRETDSHKSRDELRKTEPVGSTKVSILKPPNLCNSSVGVDRHSPKNVSTGTNPHRKTPHPVSVQQDNGRTIGFTPNLTATDCKIQLPLLRPEEGLPSAKPTFRGGSTTRRNTRANPKKRASSPCPSSNESNWFKHDAFFGDGGCDFGPSDFEFDICDRDRSDVDFHPDKKLKMDTNKRPVTRSISKETMLTLNSSMPITSRRKSKKPR